MNNIEEESFREPAFLDLIRKRDRGAIEKLVRAYSRRFHNTLLGMGLDHDDAQEVVQQVWVTFFEKASTFEGRSHIKTWLFGILYHKCQERRRMRINDSYDDSIERKVDSQFDGRGRWRSSPMDPERFAILADQMAVLEKCLERLGDSQRMAFVMKESEEMNSKEICNVLDISRTNLRVLLFRARNQLRECIQSRNNAHGEKKL